MPNVWGGLIFIMWLIQVAVDAAQWYCSGKWVQKCVTVVTVNTINLQCDFAKLTTKKLHKYTSTGTVHMWYYEFLAMQVAWFKE